MHPIWMRQRFLVFRFVIVLFWLPSHCFVCVRVYAFDICCCRTVVVVFCTRFRTIVALITFQARLFRFFVATFLLLLLLLDFPIVFPLRRRFIIFQALQRLPELCDWGVQNTFGWLFIYSHVISVSFVALEVFVCLLFLFCLWAWACWVPLVLLLWPKIPNMGSDNEQGKSQWFISLVCGFGVEMWFGGIFVAIQKRLFFIHCQIVRAI